MFKLLKIGRSVTKRFSHHSKPDTIFALSSGNGKCGVAVIRVSGSKAGTALKLMTNQQSVPKPRTAILKNIKNPINGVVLDKGLVLWFPGPRSFSGEDSFEFQVHGGLAVINGILEALGTIPQCRLAEPGEFTRRAFFNGKIDLTEVEGLADLLQAETEAQRKQAFLQTQGSLSNLYSKWKSILIRNVAHIEAHIDFDETETLELGIIETVRKDTEELKEEIKKHICDGRKGEILRNGVKTVILGEPNVGKSSLLNLLCQRPAAIVTPIEGTTRDILEVTLNIKGYPLVLADTAGLRNKTSDIIEQEGINRALQLFKKSDLIIIVVDTEKYNKWKANNNSKNINDYIIEYINNLKLAELLKADRNGIAFNKSCIIVFNKCDLDRKQRISNDKNVVSISCLTEDGINDLLDRIFENLKELCGEPSAEHPSMNQMRHRQHLKDCLNALELSIKYSNKEQDLVLMAEYLRKSLKSLGKLAGTVTTEELLDVIFRDFCIGK